jgi:CheY-like chemotaxis protein
MPLGVLIADSDADRARQVAVACRTLGIEVRVVSHGAAALEVALAEKPIAMVAQAGLPLIDGTRLAEILHANPHTCAMRMLFIDDGAQSDQECNALGRVIPGRADPETIARFIEALLRERRPEAVARAASLRSAPGVEGKLTQISLPELIELFHVNRKTGVIELRASGGRRAATGRIDLCDGDVVQARTGNVEGEKALYRLLGWRRGGFAFREQPVARERGGLDRPTRALLREAQRQAEEWKRLGGELPAPHARVALKVARSSLPGVLHPLTQEVLLVLELSSRVSEVLDRCSFPDYQVLRTLQTLIRRGMVQLHADGATPEPPAGGLFGAAFAARLHDWLEARRAREAAAADAKVVLFASDPEAGRAFASLLAGLPGIERTPASDRDAAAVAPLLRIPVDDDVAIEVVDVSTAPRFAPVWALAAHGALAIWFVHGGSLDASVAALRDASELATGLPHARCFHVRLEEKDGDRRGVAALCEKLGLFDERHALALCAERPDEATQVLRSLLTRLLP